MHYDILSKIKNAQGARKETFLTAYSNVDLDTGKVLVAARYIKDIQKKVVNKKQYLEIKLAYTGKTPALSDFKILSRPGRRLYIGSKDIRPVKQNFGIGIISTPNGILDAREARRQKVGGEYLCQVW